MDYKYSVLTYNIGGYEKLHELNFKDDDVEYVYVTDDHTITSNTWNVVYVDDLTGDNFDKCFQIRYNPFNYVHTDIVMKIDGSMTINKSLLPFFQYFEDKGYDMAVKMHPTRDNMYDEYVAWVQQRNYPLDQANKCLKFMGMLEGYDVKQWKGLAEFNLMIQRNVRWVNDFNRMTYSTIKYLSPDDATIDRLDQTIGSFILQKYFRELKDKVMVISHLCCMRDWEGKLNTFTWYRHNSDMEMNGAFGCPNPFFFNERVEIAPLV